MLKTAKEVFDIEIEALKNLRNRIDENFNQSVKTILGCKGKVVVCGMGKSGNIGRKIAATFASTGTPAFFLHPAEALHGDMGMLSSNDIVLAISYSGETDEFDVVLPAIKRMGLQLISMTGNTRSTLAKYSDIVLDISVKREACPLGLAPTASTTATLVLGDALAIAVLKEKGFTKKDFAFLHPGGTLGKRMLLRVVDLMHKGDELPIVRESDTLRKAIIIMSQKRFGIIAVVDKKQRLVAVFTNGDLMRALEKHKVPPLEDAIKNFSTYNPKTIEKDALANEAIKKMEDFKITVLMITDKQGKLEGLIHMHDILSQGIM
ncbi:MAG: KpsF/GutQ family sugar-phosphate isomerase [Candidatus Hydrogenedentota bacterium]